MSDKICIVFRPTSGRDRFNLIEFQATLMNGNTPVDRVIMGSGARGAQELVHPAIDRAGSLRPIPEGVYRIGEVEHNPAGWGPGLGNWWVSLFPVKPANNRDSFGIHLDSNRNAGSPGSAGCPIAATPDRLDRILKWIEAKNRPDLFYVDYGKGYLAQIGMPAPIEQTASAPKPEPEKPTDPPQQCVCPPAAPPPAYSTTAKIQRWTAALKAAKPAGCSQRTAAQDGLFRGGYDASQQMAKTDLGRAKSVESALRQAEAATGIPLAVCAAIASRESRVGNALDSGGWGDRGNAFGIMQVDKRYHNIVTSGGPKGAGHCVQAMTIFEGYLRQIEENHPSWPDWALLQGAAVAYNSGVSNVQSIERMDWGTTGDDYGSDVLARAQYYLNAL